MDKHKQAIVQKAIQKAIKFFGSKAKLARAAGVTQAAVDWWISRGRVGPKSAKAIEKATNGEITRYELTDFFD